MVRGVYGVRGGKFELRLGGQYRGRFDSVASASKHAARIAGAKKTCLSRKVDRVELAAKRFASAKETFKTWRPADMKDLIEVRKKNALFCIAPGPLYMLAIVGKERAWRAELIRLAQGLSPSTRANLFALSGKIGPDAGAQRVRTAVAQDLHRLLVAEGFGPCRARGQVSGWAVGRFGRTAWLQVFACAEGAIQSSDCAGVWDREFGPAQLSEHGLPWPAKQAQMWARYAHSISSMMSMSTTTASMAIASSS